jgi:hypothetical protein
MSAPTYLARAGEAFVAPNYTGAQPVHDAASATATQITATNQTYDADLEEFRSYKAVREAIRQQILNTVESTYHDVLAGDDFGYANVTIVQLLAHFLRTTHATLTDDDLEVNRNKLATPWNPDEPIENLWLQIKHIRSVATVGGEPLTNGTVMRLTLSALEKLGYANPIKTWRDKPEADRAWANFVPHFEHGEKERGRLLTAANAGYHDANTAVTPDVAMSPPIRALASAATMPTQFQYNNCPLLILATAGLID